MTLRTLLAALALALPALLAACGDGPDKDPPPAATATPTSPPVDTGPFGKAPLLGGNVTKVAPEYAQRIPQAATKPATTQSRAGVCAEVNFEGLTEGNAQWFRMAYDGKEVTVELTWFVTRTDELTDGVVCYAPTAGLAVGLHNAALTVRDPRSSTAPARQVIAWKFEVVP
ncbi:MAG: hypothetical protein ACR2HN_04075 [Tepidiformaceae bacterium]